MGPEKRVGEGERETAKEGDRIHVHLAAQALPRAPVAEGTRWPSGRGPNGPFSLGAVALRMTFILPSCCTITMLHNGDGTAGAGQCDVRGGKPTGA